MSGFKRGSVLGAGLALTSLLAACSGGAEPPAGETPQEQPKVAVNNPKDASAVPLCSLLSDDFARSLELQTPGEHVPQMVSGAGEACEWRSDEADSLSVSLSVLDRKIADYYAKPPFPYFSERSVAGNPAAVTLDSDPMQLGICDLYLGTQENQMLVSQVILPSTDKGKKDPCQVAQQTLEAAVTTLPPAK
ncbi:DUF3558 domain-containing protein [Saccharopolyspora taberi]